MPDSIDNGEKKVWSLTTIILTAMGTLSLLLMTAVAVLSVMGFSNLTEQMKASDTAIYKKIDEDGMAVKNRLNEICQQNAKTNEILMKHTEDIAVLRTNQQTRLDREKRQGD